MEVAIPKLRNGSYFPEWLLERRRRAESALISVVATCYLLGVSTRRMDKLVQSLGITGLSKSQVSEMAASLDEEVAAFRTRPLDDGPYTFVAADALTIKVREGGRVVKVAVMIATGVNADGYREILGVQASSSESGAGWLAFFRDLLARGLSGVALVTSDATPDCSPRLSGQAHQDRQPPTPGRRVSAKRLLTGWLLRGRGLIPAHSLRDPTRAGVKGLGAFGWREFSGARRC